MFSILSKTEISLTPFLIHHFETVPNSKKLLDDRWNVAIIGFKTTECIENIVKKGEIASKELTLYPTTYILNPFPNKPWFLRVCSTSLLKTLREKEKLLVTRNFSFSHSVFYPFGKLSAISIKFKIAVCLLFQFGSVQNMSFGKGLMTLRKTILKIIVRKWNKRTMMVLYRSPEY